MFVLSSSLLLLCGEKGIRCILECAFRSFIFRIQRYQSRSNGIDDSESLTEHTTAITDAQTSFSAASFADLRGGFARPRVTLSRLFLSVPNNTVEIEFLRVRAASVNSDCLTRIRFFLLLFFFCSKNRLHVSTS